MTRGYRNNNPGNIRKSASPWIGQVLPGDDDAFCTFTTMGYGYRAMFVLLQNYINKGFNTIDKIINRWAPSSENNTQAYINNVVARTGINKDQLIEYSDGETMKLLVAAISYQENGTAPNFTDVSKGYELTGQIQTVETVGVSLAAIVLISSLAFAAFQYLKVK
jgi:hypothetical protein